MFECTHEVTTGEIKTLEEYGKKFIMSSLAQAGQFPLPRPGESPLPAQPDVDLYNKLMAREDKELAKLKKTSPEVLWARYRKNLESIMKSHIKEHKKNEKIKKRLNAMLLKVQSSAALADKDCQTLMWRMKRQLQEALDHYNCFCYEEVIKDMQKEIDAGMSKGFKASLIKERENIREDIQQQHEAEVAKCKELNGWYTAFLEKLKK